MTLYLKKSNNLSDINNLYVVVYNNTYYGFEDSCTASLYIKYLESLEDFKKKELKGFFITDNIKNKSPLIILLVGTFIHNYINVKLSIRIKITDKEGKEKFNDFPCSFLLDTGAQMTLVPHQFFDNFNKSDVDKLIFGDEQEAKGLGSQPVKYQNITCDFDLIPGKWIPLIVNYTKSLPLHADLPRGILGMDIIRFFHLTIDGPHGAYLIPKEDYIKELITDKNKN